MWDKRETWKRGKSNYRIGIMWDEREIWEEGQN